MIIKNIYIDKFRDITNTEITLGKYITAIAGRNASMKSTLLGIIGQIFTIPSKGHPLSGVTTIDGYAFKSQFSEKFRFSENEKPKDHKWTTFFYNGKYKDESFTCESMYRTKATKKLRFWNAKNHEAGSGYVNIPVYYLSLSRLYPIGEIKQFKKSAPSLSDEESIFFIRHHKEILCNTYSSDEHVGIKNSTRKMFSGINTDKYDVNSNSAGEDNIGKILLSILSFKKIQREHKNDYKGGILLIDEIDAAVYPYSQVKLIKFLYEQAQETHLQIVFTTHSPTVLKTINRIKEYDDDESASNSHIMPNRALLYLHREYNSATKNMDIVVSDVHKQYELNKWIADINLEPFHPSTINIYLEDDTAKRFFNYIIGANYAQYINPIDVNLGWTNYIQLHQKAVPEFCQNSLIILDHDVLQKLKEKDYRHQKKYLDEHKPRNILYLPIDIEKGFYKMLRNRDNYSMFANITELSYDVCFRDFIENDLSNSNEYKHWYGDVLNMIDNNESAFYDTWLKLHKDDADDFINQFKVAYNELADKLALDLIMD